MIINNVIGHEQNVLSGHCSENRAEDFIGFYLTCLKDACNN